MPTISHEAVKSKRIHLRETWKEAPYYAEAEQPSWLSPFWDHSGYFRPLFERLNLNSVVELACGRGRHTAQALHRIGKAVLIDINDTNIRACTARFAGHRSINCLINEGHDIPLPNDTATSVFCYDAMVHFEALDVIAYVFEAHRVLQPGGRALLHYSANEATPEGLFTDGLHWRNYFSEGLMRHAASRAGFRVLERKTFPWPPETDGPVSDGLILLEKPF